MALPTLHSQDKNPTSLGDSGLFVQFKTGISDHFFVTSNGNHKVVCIVSGLRSLRDGYRNK